MEDLSNLTALADNPAIAKNMTDTFPSPYKQSNAVEFINFAMSGQPCHIFAIEFEGQLCGGIGVHSQSDVHRKNMELGYWLGEQFWGNGIAVKAIELIVQYAFATFDISRIFARPYGHNIASQKVLIRSGFIQEAHFHATIFKDGQYEDELIYAFRR